ncbi:MAG: hypothetical protein H0U73_05615, partial [Tatlockia sp.]|nr:hypothetical protein [Tatlockia sp.]
FSINLVLVFSLMLSFKYPCVSQRQQVSEIIFRLNRWGLLTAYSKNALLFDDLYRDSIDKTSLSLSSLSTTEDDPLRGVVRTGFIKALVIEGHPSNQYQFQNSLFRDYFYALSWVDNYTSRVAEERANARYELITHLCNPSYKIIWALVTGILARSEHKDKFQFFIDQIYSNQIFGHFCYFLQAACFQEAKMALLIYYDKTVNQIARSLENQLAKLDDNHLAIKLESLAIIQLLKQYPFFLQKSVIVEVLKKDGRLVYSNELIGLCKEKDESSSVPTVGNLPKNAMRLLLDELEEIKKQPKSLVGTLFNNSKRKKQLLLILESIHHDKKIKDINQLVEHIIKSANDRTRNILFLSLIDYSHYLGTLDLNPLKPEEIPILFKTTINPLFHLFKRFSSTHKMFIKLVPLIVEYLEEKGVTLYFQDDKTLVLMDGERKEIFLVEQANQVKSSIREFYNLADIDKWPDEANVPKVTFSSS